MKKDDTELLQWLYNRLIHECDEDERVDYMVRFKKLIDDAKPQPLRDRYVIVTENDMGKDRWMESLGPIAMETYVGESNISKVIERSKSLGDRYGRQMICRLDPLGDLDAFKKLMNQE